MPTPVPVSRLPAYSSGRLCCITPTDARANPLENRTEPTNRDFLTPAWQQLYLQLHRRQRQTFTSRGYTGGNGEGRAAVASLTLMVHLPMMAAEMPWAAIISDMG